MDAIVETEYYVEWRMKKAHRLRQDDNKVIIEADIPTAGNYERLLPREFVMEPVVDRASRLAVRFKKCEFRVVEVKAIMQIMYEVSAITMENNSE